MSPDSYITKLYEYMVYYRDNLANISLKAVCQKAENDLESARKAELLTRNEEKTFLRVNTFLENIWLKMEGITQTESDIYEKVKEAFSREADGLEKQTETVDQTLQNVFDYPTVRTLCNFLKGEKKEKVRYKESDFDKYKDLFHKNVVEEDAIFEKQSLGNVLLTGATGFLGAHVLNELMQKENGKIYCLIRRRKSR